MQHPRPAAGVDDPICVHGPAVSGRVLDLHSDSVAKIDDPPAARVSDARGDRVAVQCRVDGRPVPVRIADRIRRAGRDQHR